MVGVLVASNPFGGRKVFVFSPLTDHCTPKVLLHFFMATKASGKNSPIPRSMLLCGSCYRHNDAFKLLQSNCKELERPKGRVILEALYPQWNDQQSKWWRRRLDNVKAPRYLDDHELTKHPHPLPVHWSYPPDWMLLHEISTSLVTGRRSECRCLYYQGQQDSLSTVLVIASLKGPKNYFE